MSKHTAGPWELKNTADIFTPLGATNAEGIAAPSNDGWHIADCDMGGLCLAEVKANARLIAAAPDLLEALESALTAAEFEKHPARPWHSQARAAIAKARGQS